MARQNKTEQINLLHEQNDEFENYFRNTIIAQFFVDACLKLRKFTPAAMKQFKLRHEHIGQPLENITEHFKYADIISSISQVIATGKILEKDIQTNDLRWYKINITPYILIKEGTSNGVIVTFLDITSKIRDLKEQEKLIADHELLLDTIAHDIKNPLLSLSLIIELIKKQPEKNLKSSFLFENLETSVLQMKKLVNELVANRWTNHPYQVEEELLDMAELLIDVKLALAPQILESQAEISDDLMILEIRFVKRKLRSLIYNLLSNAIKYTPVGRIPVIFFRTYEQNDQLVISVQDNGIGLSTTAQNQIFEKFQRVRSSTEGSGVGLYLVHTIVSSVQGKITIESKLNQGSHFKIYLPIKYN